MPKMLSYRSSSGSMVMRLRDNGEVVRYAGTPFGNADLWTGAWTVNPNLGKTFNDVYLAAMPSGILTSQGLV
jgi:hypothetical protein